MFLYKIVTFPNTEQQNDEHEKFIEEQNWYIAALQKNGQILSHGNVTVFEDGKFINYVLTPEINSLNSVFNNRYVNEFLNNLIQLSSSVPTNINVGKSTDFEPSCTCQSPSSYILYTEMWHHVSPVSCGDCKKTIPLYKLPKINEEDEYFSVLSWQKAFNACDRLFYEGINERGAYKQMSNPASELSIMGRKICTLLEQATGKPFYYNLYRQYSRKKKVCPSCGETWDKESGLKKYCCQKCRLVSE
ncbi:DUF2310 family Zn-ribbon-containing protein [Cohnella sp. GCM10012308]|uniref:DUF2310 family Zn-ribbon-containing protein n=1 Tax=Cohnella sp. GCM10012308 TaxID=3317329 RepID=UPI00360903B4